MIQKTFAGITSKPVGIPELPGLILARNVGQWIDIFVAGEHIQIKVHKARQCKASLKIVANKYVKIVRREVLERSSARRRERASD